MIFLFWVGPPPREWAEEPISIWVTLFTFVWRPSIGSTPSDQGQDADSSLKLEGGGGEWGSGEPAKQKEVLLGKKGSGSEV